MANGEIIYIFKIFVLLYGILSYISLTTMATHFSPKTLLNEPFYFLIPQNIIVSWHLSNKIPDIRYFFKLDHNNVKIFINFWSLPQQILDNHCEPHLTGINDTKATQLLCLYKQSSLNLLIQLSTNALSWIYHWSLTI